MTPLRTVLALGAMMGAVVAVFPERAGALPAMPRAHVLRLDAIGRGYGATPVFYVPVKKRWGITWRYNCGQRPGEFDFVIWEVINAVELPYTLTSEHGRRGAGMRMETGQTSGITMPGGQQAGKVLSLHVKTACAWHIRVVAGPMAVVKRWIPRRVDRSSWTK